jgi:hypothetical protein
VDELHLPRRAAGDEVARLTAIAALPEPRGAVAAALAEAQAAIEMKKRAAEAEAEARRREADGHLLAARDALAAAKYDDAVRDADAAEHAGGAVGDLRQEISTAREATSQQHQQQAREFIRKNDPDAALKEVERAEALGSGSLAQLRDAIANTPKARHREALRKQEARRDEARRAAARRETCRLVKATVATVSRQRALQVASVFTTGSLDPYQKTVNLVNAIEVMGKGSSVYAQDALGRVEASTMLAAVRGATPRSYAALGVTNANFVQQRDMVFYSLLNRVISERGQLSGRVHEQVRNAASFPDYLLASKDNFTAYTAIVAASIPDLSEKLFRAAVAEMYCTTPSNFVER